MSINAAVTEQSVVAALRRAGGEATMSVLARELGAHRDTVRKHLAPLLDQGVVESPSRGRYRLSGLPPFSSERASELVAVLEHSGYEAHLTGFDLLARYAHQFVYAFPHLVYADPTAVDAVEAALTEAGFVVTHAGPHRNASAPEVDRVVVLRGQSKPEQYGVRGVAARVEKAWVDALRETSRGNLDLSYLELGRILRALTDDGADQRYLRRYARQLGYLARVNDAMSDTVPVDAPSSTVALHAGFWS
jgi:DNA-binding transcriptional ArsR family regulator